MRKAQAKSVFFATVPYIFIQGFSFIFILSIIFIYRDTNNFLNLIPLLALWLLALQRLIPSFNEVFSGLSTIKSLIQNYNDTEELVYLNEYKYKVNQEEILFKNKISFNSVNFNFGEKNILKDVNFDITKNSIFGIKGHTGSGKSTILNILMGNYKSQKGEVEIDGKKLEDKHILDWHKKISYVPQKVYLIDDSIKSNIAFGEESINEKLINHSIEKALLSNFIEGQPKGYETYIGENAIRISGGQKQRIGIARAIYRDTNILILDESLNSLDLVTKNQILQNLKKMKKTIIIISHDEYDLKICDKIFYLN